MSLLIAYDIKRFSHDMAIAKKKKKRKRIDPLLKVLELPTLESLSAILEYRSALQQ